MRVCTWAVICGALIGAATEAGEVASATRRTSLSISSGDDAAGEVLVTATSSAIWPAPPQASPGWLPFRNGHLWADYCLSPNCAALPAATAGPRPATASWRRTKLTLPNFWRRSSRTGCRQRSSALDLLRGLLGWQPRPAYYVACQERLDCPEPASVIPVDDPPPTPPALLDPIESRERKDATLSTEPQYGASPPAEPDVAPAPTDPDLALPVPTDPAPAEDADGAPGDIELSPAPADDPAPEPKPEVPRNKLPKPRSARDAVPGTNGRTVMASRLSDFIRTR